MRYSILLALCCSALAADDVNEQLSVSGAIASTGKMTRDVFKYALEQTTVDDAAAEHLSRAYGHAKTFTVDFTGKVQEFDYKPHLHRLQTHDLYLQHVAPAVKDLHAKAAPHVEALHLGEHYSKANDLISPHVATLKQKKEDLLLVLQQLSERMHAEVAKVPDRFATVEGSVGNAISPVFDFLTRVSPNNAKILPSTTLDRVLFMIAFCIFSYYALLVLSFVLRIMLKVVVKVFLKMVTLALWFATCFYCCGLCRRKNKKVEDGKATKTETGKQGKKKAEKVTVGELQQLLDASQKKGKLQDAVKLLVSKEKDCKPLEGKAFPEDIRGKLLDKDVLKKAFQKYKEIDMKKL